MCALFAEFAYIQPLPSSPSRSWSTIGTACTVSPFNHLWHFPKMMQVIMQAVLHLGWQPEVPTTASAYGRSFLCLRGAGYRQVNRTFSPLDSHVKRVKRFSPVQDRKQPSKRNLLSATPVAGRYHRAGCDASRAGTVEKWEGHKAMLAHPHSEYNCILKDEEMLSKEAHDMSLFHLAIIQRIGRHRRMYGTAQS